MRPALLKREGWRLDCDAILRVAIGELDRGTMKQRLAYIAETCRIMLRSVYPGDAPPVIPERESCTNATTAEPLMQQFGSYPVETTGTTFAKIAESPSTRSLEHQACECTSRHCALHRDVWRHYENAIAVIPESREKGGDRG